MGRVSRRRFLAGLGAGIAGVATYSKAWNPTEPRDDPRVIGHRGASAHYEDNTREGFKFAKLVGAHGVETDVRLSADDQLVIHHDPIMLSDVGVPMQVSETTYDTLQSRTQRDVLQPSDILDMFDANDYALVFGIKNSDAVPYLNELLEEREVVRDVSYASFFPRGLERAPEQARRILVGSLPSQSLLEDATAHSVDAVAPHHVSGVTDDFAKDARRNGFGVGCWAFVDKKRDIEEIASGNLDFIVTNRPDAAVDVLGR